MVWRWKCTQDLVPPEHQNTVNTSDYNNQTVDQSLQISQLTKQLEHLLPVNLANTKDTSQLITSALNYVEESLLNKVREAGEDAMESIRDMKSADVSLLAHIGYKIKNFLQISLERYHDLINESTKEKVWIGVHVIKTVLPYLSLIVHTIPASAEDREIAEANIILDLIETEIIKIVDCFERTPVNGDNDEVIGHFLTLVDNILDCTNQKSFSIMEFNERVKKVIRHALILAKISKPEDASQLNLVCKSIADTLAKLTNKELQDVADMSIDSLEDEERSRIYHIQDMITHLEENVNRSLLRLYSLSGCRSDSHVDTLLLHILNSNIPVTQRHAQHLDTWIHRLDEETDDLLNLCEFCAASSRNMNDARILKSCHQAIQSLEKDLVPAIIQLYLYPHLKNVRSTVRILRQLWRGVELQARMTLKKIVDPVAMSLVILQESKKIAKKVCEERMYEQNTSALKSDINQLIGMCETGVDITWQEYNLTANKLTVPLPDTHPLVKTERAIWELKAALKLVVGNAQDLELHKGLVKRMKVVINSYSLLSSFLVETCQDQNDEVSQHHNILSHHTDEDCITHKHHHHHTSIERRSATSKLSFYSIKDPEKSKNLTLSIRKDLYRLTTVDISEFSPATPQLTKPRIRLSVSTAESSARLSSAIDRLSIISDELSRSLRKPKGQQINSIQTEQGVQVNVIHVKCEAGGNVSLRRRALYNKHHA